MYRGTDRGALVIVGLSGCEESPAAYRPRTPSDVMATTRARNTNSPPAPLRVALLTLYMDRFDQAVPTLRAQVTRFATLIAEDLAKRQVEVLASPLCSRRAQVREALASFERDKADALVTLHGTYSPSLEAAAELARSSLPLVLLDTTPRFDFSRARAPMEILLNQGIHGVQDLSNLLVRHRKHFAIEAGHWQASDVLDRVLRRVRTLRAASMLRGARVGLIGERFPGMGDFRLAPRALELALGAAVVRADGACIQRLIPSEDDPAVAAEVEQDRELFRIQTSQELHRATVRVGLGVRRWLEGERLDAFTMNPLSLTSLQPNALPFLEASKAMARGIGYAGEGDFLTALLSGVLARTFGEATFTEMFCPDWKNQRIFLSHIAEMNYRLAEGKPRLIEKPYTLTGTLSAVAVGRFRPGRAILVNLAPSGSNPGDPLRLTLVPGGITGNRGNRLPNVIHGWFRPSRPLERLLAEYSHHGGTHHSVLVYGPVMDPLLELGRLMQWPTVRID